MGEIILNGEKYIGNDISGKADKVQSATNGNFAGLDVNGNITDSGIAAGNTSISSIGDGTVSGAISAENGAIEAIVNVYGSKNLLPYPYDHTTKTESDITFTDNGDGSVTVSGTASADVGFYFKYGSLLLDVGEYIVNGCPSGGSEQTYYIATTWGNDTGNGLRFTLQQPTNSGTLLIIIKSGTVISTPITFYPMLRDARISDPTYVPYAMTNRELTEKKADKVSGATNGNLAGLDANGNLTDSGVKAIPESISVTKQGTETYKQVIQRLYNLIDWTKIKEYSTKIFVANGTGTITSVNINARLLVANWFAGATLSTYIYSILLFGDSSTMDFIDPIANSKSDVTNNEAAANWKLTLYY